MVKFKDKYAIYNCTWATAMPSAETSIRNRRPTKFFNTRLNVGKSCTNIAKDTTDPKH